MTSNQQSNISFFPQKGRSIVLNFSPDELTAVIHALEEDFERIQLSGGDRYGTLSLEDLGALLYRLHKTHPALLAVAAHS